MDLFVVGLIAGMQKVADIAIGEVVDAVHDAVRGLLDRGQAYDDDSVLSILLAPEHPEDIRLESLVLFMEEKFAVTVDDKDVRKVFETGTLCDLARIISKQTMEKKADFGSYKKHQAYYRKRHQLAIKRRQYRMAHLSKERRRGMIYKKQVKRGARRPAKRFGTAQSGYSFRGGYGSKVKHRQF